MNKLNEIARRILPYIVLFYTLLSFVAIVYAIFLKAYQLTSGFLMDLTAMWGLIFTLTYIGCIKDMSGVTEKQVKTYGILAVIFWVVSIITYLMIN